MVQNIFGVFSLLIGTAGLLLTYAGHRQKVRQEAQESALRAEELLRGERDREQEQERQEQAERARQEREERTRLERDRYQASMVGGHVVLSPSSLNESYAVPQVMIQNGSNQPVKDVRISVRGEAISQVPLIHPGQHFFPLPALQIPDDGNDQWGEVAVEFTDVSEIGWRREGYGDLQRTRQGTHGQEVWGVPEPPVVERYAGETAWPSAPDVAERMEFGEVPAPSAPRAGRRFRRLGPVALLVSVVLIAVGIWWLFH
ncbi:hypothetical protein ACFV20_36715 [Streptomyces sp. NPDC059696]|uniref:hypothetical protein n=1 Tax=Streptomyces sp. NPDC059696 TaxID=3346911 RepID=UPI0036A407C6